MLKTISALIAALSLLACLAAPVVYFRGAISAEAYEQIFSAASAAWFVFATLWAQSRRR